MVKKYLKLLSILVVIVFFWCLFHIFIPQHISFDDPVAQEKRKSVNDNPVLHKQENLVANETPTIYGITPTYRRMTQQADLTRLIHTLMHVNNFHWIVVEDSVEKTTHVTNMLSTSGLSYTHLTARTDIKKQVEIRKLRGEAPRGIEQRNAGLSWIRENVPYHKGSVMYFMDDDNTYSLKVFEEMRNTKQASCWLVAFTGGSKVEGPGKCKDGKVISWFVRWGANRAFPLDMAAFAINLELIFKNPNALFSYKWTIGYLESNFLESLNLTKSDMEAKSNCNVVLAWHTQTAKPLILDKRLPKSKKVIEI